MTAVLEPQAAGRPVPVLDHLGIQLHAAPMVRDAASMPAVGDAPASDEALNDPGAPFHCGVAMTAGPVPIASLGWAPLELGSSEWSCACGYTVDSGPAGEPLESVRLASARVESLHWELDAAQGQFENAVRTAAKRGAGQEALGRAAGLSAVELRPFLDGGGQLM